MGSSVHPYSPDNPFAQQGAAGYSPDNPFAKPQSMADRLHAEFKTGNLAKRMQSENVREAANVRDEEETNAGSYANQALGGIASLARGIPGAEAAQAGARAIVRRQPYREALGDIRGAEAAAPAGVTAFNSLAGAAPLTALLPGGAVAKGALYGGAMGAAQADPDANRTQDSILGALLGGGLGYAGSKVAKIGGLGQKAKGLLSKAKQAQTLNSLGQMEVLPEPVAAPKPTPLPNFHGPTPAPAPLPNAAPKPWQEHLEQLVSQLRQQAPLGEEAGNTIGDAELAMRPHASDDLESLLRRSLRPTP